MESVPYLLFAELPPAASTLPFPEMVDVANLLLHSTALPLPPYLFCNRVYDMENFTVPQAGAVLDRKVLSLFISLTVSWSS